MNVLRKLVDKLPVNWQRALKRLHYQRQILRGSFDSPEPEYGMLSQLVEPGDWVIDVGANIGHYTKRLSDLVAKEGRVFAFEPVPETFAFLASNTMLFQYQNVTLLNLAASDGEGVGSMTVPPDRSGQRNYYMAHLAGEGSICVVMARIDSFRGLHRVSLVKIDAEGHDSAVLRGMADLLARDRPVLIIESGSLEVVEFMSHLGYSHEILPGSPNRLFRPRKEPA